VSEAVISVQALSKRYRRYRRRHQSLKEIVAHRSRGEWEDFWALTEVSFEVPRGQFLGVIGHNGSGKSTLLKVLTGILRPNRGRVEITGRVSSLLELGAGFQSEYTGRENVFLYGTLLGLRRREVARHYDSIVEFCGLGDFMDTPVKNYSSGMYVRLGFAVAVHLDPEILLIDEVLAVGDADFQQKCFEHLHRLRSQGCTIVLVSHEMASVARFCERAIWLDHGRLMADGASDQVIQSYLEAVASGASRAGVADGGGKDGDREFVITSVRVLGSDGKQVREAESGTALRIEIGYRATRSLEGLEVGVTIFRDDGIRCVDAPLYGASIPQGRGSLVLDFPAFNLQGGSYDATVAVYDPKRHHFHEFHDRLYPFGVRDRRSTGGVTWMDYSWTVRSDAGLVAPQAQPGAGAGE
jgi:ABC-type polysaccharide/polyol phosphate transport system ATPase subunit